MPDVACGGIPMRLHRKFFNINEYGLCADNLGWTSVNTLIESDDDDSSLTEYTSST